MGKKKEGEGGGWVAPTDPQSVGVVDEESEGVGATHPPIEEEGVGLPHPCMPVGMGGWGDPPTSSVGWWVGGHPPTPLLVGGGGIIVCPPTSCPLFIYLFFFFNFFFPFSVFIFDVCQAKVTFLHVELFYWV